MAAQLIAAHNAAMECYRRAMLGEQNFEGRRENLSQANKLSRTYATLLEALNRHCRMHGGKSPGAPKGNNHAFKHGRFTAEAIAERREFAALVREMKGLIEQIGDDE